MKGTNRWMIGLLVISGLMSCSNKDESKNEPQIEEVRNKSIVILYENDVHGAIEYYPVLAGLRDAIVKADTSWTAVVSSGDYLSGDASCTLEKGKYIVQMMSSVGYDAVTIGNHEFDWGGKRLMELLPDIKTSVVCTNFYDCATGKQMLPSYTIKTYGDKKVAFVGVVTPDSEIDEAYSFYDSEGNKLYDLKAENVSQLVQKAVDDARGEGADYVVLLSHLGELETKSYVTSISVVKETNGIDVVLDGHTHNVIPYFEVENKDGKKVKITQTGTKFSHIGKLLIKDGQIHTELVYVPSCQYKSEKVSATLDEVNNNIKGITGEVLGTTAFDLTIEDAAGNRLCRSGETNLGDYITDVMLESVGGDISLINGGALRKTIKAGTITFGDVMDAFPFLNYMYRIRATGKDLLNMLNESTKTLPQEDGSFPHVAHMKYTVHRGSHTVSDVLIYNNETKAYEALDPEKQYIVATIDYYKGGGFYDTLKDCEVVEQTTKLLMYELGEYIKKHQSIGEEYKNSQGRITILDD